MTNNQVTHCNQRILIGYFWQALSTESLFTTCFTCIAKIVYDDGDDDDDRGEVININVIIINNENNVKIQARNILCKLSIFVSPQGPSIHP